MLKSLYKKMALKPQIQETIYERFYIPGDDDSRTDLYT